MAFSNKLMAQKFFFICKLVSTAIICALYRHIFFVYLSRQLMELDVLWSLQNCKLFSFYSRNLILFNQHACGLVIQVQCI